MSFLVLPPEINSAQMFSGLGSGPMLAAAAAWEGLADELGSAADSFGAVTSGLVGGPWQGSAAAAMAGAAAPYAGWLHQYRPVQLRQHQHRFVELGRRRHGHRRYGQP
ncbi:MAG TPA: PPE family protein [Mycobacterium sp.]|nr:PPE family protein [Mycobacterium sp.]HTQ16808.1 PPE family protein [Mycobacterium sp.]